MNGFKDMLKRLTMVRAIALGIVIGAFYYFAMYDSGSRQTDNITNTKAEIDRLNRELTENQKKLDRAAVYKKTAAEIGTTINRLLGVIPEKFGISDLTKIVSNEARIAGSSLNNITPGNPEISSMAKEFEEFSVHLEVNGSFKQHMVFLSNLTKINQILIVRKFDLQTSREAKGEDTALVRMTADIVAYRYRGNINAPAVKPGGPPVAPPPGGHGD